MKYGSVCSGIEAATIAWEPLGWEPVFFSEIEAFPRAVLKHHYPTVPCHGDFTTIKRNDYAAIDVLVGGTPCQDFSLAGLRAGLDGGRGNLSLEFGKLLGRLRPQWFVWENVPGVFSSNGGQDFAGILGMFTGRSIEVPGGGWQNSGVVQGIDSAYSVAWATLDAQFFGVAQRRRRVFVVGCLGADWRRPLAVLLDRTSLSGDPAPSRKKGKDVAPCFDTSAPGNDPIEVAPTLDARCKNGPMQNQVGMAVVGFAEFSDSHLPLREAEGGDCGGGSEAIIVMGSGQGGADPFGDFGTTLTCLHEAPIVVTPISGGWPPEIAPTLDASYSDKWGLDNQHIDGGAGLFVPIVVKTSDTGSNGSNFNEDGVAYTIDTTNGQAVLQPTVFDTTQITSPQNKSNPKAGDPCHTLSANGDAPLLVQPMVSYGVDEECNANEELFGPLLRGGDGGTKQTVVQIPIGIDGNEVGFTLRANPSMSGDKGDGGMNTTVVAVEEPVNFQQSQSGIRENDTMGTLDTNYGSRRYNGVRTGSHVRRLTPKEASRLQGFTDDFARIPWKGKPADQCPDGPQYKAYGNSMATTVMAWIGERLQMVHDLIMEGKI